MAVIDKSINALDAATTPAAADLVPIFQGATTKKATLTQIQTVLASGSVTPRAMATRLAEVANVKDFGALGDGVTDDRAALVAAFAYITANGGELYFPVGNYTISSGIVVVTGGTKPFVLRGAGIGNTKITRNTNAAGSVLEVRSTDDWVIRDMSVIANHSLYAAGDHAVVALDCNRHHIYRVATSDYKNSGILSYTTVDGVTAFGDNIIEECSADGNSTANLGMLIVNQVRSKFINCTAKNIATGGSPGYGIQFKNNCRDCVMINPQVHTARYGVVISNDQVGADVNLDNRVIGGFAYNCAITGLDLAAAHRPTVVGFKVDMNNQGNDACTFDANTTGADVAIDTCNVASAKGCVKFVSGATDNVVRVTTADNPTSGVKNFASIFNSGSLRNNVRLEQFTTPTTVDSTTALNSNAGGVTNVFEYGYLPQRQAATIASGVIAVTDNKTRFVQVDTEAAAATDDLDTITPGTDLQVITLYTTNNARDVVVKYNTGNIRINGSIDMTLDNTVDTLTLMYQSVVSKWVEIGRGNNL